MIHIFHPDGRTLPIDVTTKIAVMNSAAAASHPIERGQPVIDHVEPSNTELAFSCIITEHPTESQANAVEIVVVETQTREIVTRGKTGHSRVQAASDFLKDCIGELVDIYDLGGRVAYTDALLIQYPYSMSIKRASPFTLNFIIPRLVEAEGVAIPARAGVPAGLSGEPPDPDAKSTDDDDEMSILDRMGHKALDFLFGVQPA